MTVSDCETDTLGPQHLQQKSDDPFHELRHLQNSKLENHKLTMSVLKAVEEAITLGGLRAEPANYYSALWPLLWHPPKSFSVPGAKDEEWLGAVLGLVSRVIPLLDECYLQEKYSELFQGLEQLVRGPAFGFAPVARPLIAIAAAVLSLTEWPESGKDLFLGLLVRPLLDARPKVRKAAQQGVLDVVMSGRLDIASSDALLQLAAVSLHQSTRRECQASMHLLPFLTPKLPSLVAIAGSDSGRLRECLQAAEYCLGLGNNMLSAKVFAFVAGLSSSSQTIAASCFECLFKAQPGPEAQELLVSWLVPFAQSAAAATSAKDAVVKAIDAIFKAVDMDAPEVLMVAKTAVEIVLASGPASVALDKEQLASHLNTKLNVRRPGDVAMLHPALLDICRLTFEAFKAELLPSFASTVQLLAMLHGKRGLQPSLAASIEAILQDTVGYLGCATFLGLVPLKLLPQDQGKNGWLIGVLQKGIVNDSLGVYLSNILPLAETLHSCSQKLAGEEKEHDARVHDTVSQQLIALLPAFMRYPTDFSSAFSDAFAGQLAAWMNASPALRPVICNALSDFVERSLAFEEEVVSGSLCLPRPLQAASVTGDIEMFGQKFAPKYLPVLFNLAISSPVDQRSYLLRTIETILKTGPPAMAASFLAKLIERLPQVANDSEQCTALLDIAGALLAVAGVQCEEAGQLYAVAKQGILVQSVHIQKRSYRLLSILLKSCPEERLDFFSGDEELIRSLAEASLSCDPAARKARFQVLCQLGSCDTVLKVLVPAALAEVISGTKEINSKTRQAAFDLIVQWARAYSLRPEGLPAYLEMIVAGLAARTSSMMAASLLAAARVVFEFGRDPSISELVPLLLDDSLTIMHSKCKEVIKAAIGLVKVAVSSVDRAVLQSRLGKILDGLLVWAGEHTQHFKTRVRGIVERLVRMFGFDTVLAACPLEHQALIKNINQRRERRAKRQRGLQSEPAPVPFEGGRGRRPFEETMFDDNSELSDADSDLSVVGDLNDSDIDDALSKKLSLKTFKTSRTSKTGLSSKSLRSARTGISSRRDGKKAKGVSFAPTTQAEPKEFKRNKAGKMIIAESDSDHGVDVDAVQTGDIDDASFYSAKKRTGKRKWESSDEPSPDLEDRRTIKTGLTSLSRKTALTARSASLTERAGNHAHRVQKRKAPRSDSLKKGQVEPYAYVPLQRKRAGRGDKQDYHMRSKNKRNSSSGGNGRRR